MSALLDNKLPANPATNPSGEPAKPRKPIKVTAKRRAANRRNARLSTGPKTEEGKSRSRENALKHGMAGAGVVMHAADLGPLQIRLDQWTETLQPADPVEGWLVGRAALASVRVDRCAREEQVQFLDRVAGTTRKWNEGRLQLVEEEAKQIDTRPAMVVEHLLSVSLGCDWLMQQWQLLERSWITDGHWKAATLTRVLRLLGQAALPTLQSSPELVALWKNVLGASLARADR